MNRRVVLIVLYANKAFMRNIITVYYLISGIYQFKEWKGLTPQSRMCSIGMSFSCAKSRYIILQYHYFTGKTGQTTKVKVTV